MKYIIVLLLLSSQAQASFPEFFGSSAVTGAIANQPILDASEASNGYYAASLLAHSKKLSISLSGAHSITDVPSITNIVVKNSTNSNLAGATVERSDANTDYADTTMGSIHALLPLAYQGAGALVLNVFTPLGAIAEINSGDPFLPEYVMHRARTARTQAFLSYAHPWSEKIAFSLGGMLGFQAGADIGNQATLNGSDFGSSASLKSKIKPTIGLSFSASHRGDKTQTYFSFHQEMKSNLSSVARGEINDPVPALFSIEINTMISYDPHTLRLGHARRFESFSLFALAEYQIWSGYQTPVVRIRKIGGVLNPSDDFEKTKIKNIFVPKVGMSVHLTPKWDWSLGASYRPTPIEGDFSGSGNSVDVDSAFVATGFRYKTTVRKRNVEFSNYFQYHQFKDRTVTKTDGQENGEVGEKIGSTGYKLGGSAMAAGLGMTLLF